MAFAQQQIFEGYVKDEASLPVQVATVTLLQATDSAWVQSVFTDDNGKFLFEKAEKGKYLVDVHAIGYEQVKVPVTIDEEHRPITITAAKLAGSLQEVTVTASKPFIENSAGKMTVNVASSVAGAGSTAFDVLRKSPGVVIDEEGNISLKGKQGVTVLINERPTYLSGKQLADYLRSLPSDDIAKLELITQPSAKYDAEGSGGIINIVQKKNKKEGYNATASITPGTGIYANIRANAAANYKKDGLNTYANASYMSATGFLRAAYKRELLDAGGNTLTIINGGIFMKELFSDDMLRAGIDYDVNNNTTVGAMVSGNYHPNTELDETTDEITDVANGQMFYNRSKHEQGFIRKRIVANAYMNNKLSEKQKVATNADYTHSFTKKRQYLHSTNEDVNGGTAGNNLIIRSWEPVTIDAYSLKSDYTADVSPNAQLEMGVKAVYTKIDNDADFDIYNNGAWVDDMSRTNHFVYHENVNAAYASVNKSIGEQWKLQAGLRVENANISGQQKTTGESFERSAVSLFPTAYVSYKLNKKHECQLNYGRRIERPWYRALNPFPDYTSQYQYRIGNPRLQPEMTHSIELSHVYDGMLTTNIGFSRTNNMISGIVYRDENQPNVTYNKDENIAQQNSATMSLTMYKKLLAWWEMTVMGYGYYSDYYDGIRNAHTYGNGYGVNVDSQFVFKGGWKAEAHVNVMGRRQEGIYGIAEPAVYSSCGVSKKLFKDSATIRLSMEDPFGMYKYNWSANTGDVQASGQMQYNTRYYGMSFTYNIGSGSGGRQRDVNNDEVKRM